MTLDKICISLSEGIINFFLYERRNYESVDEKDYLRLCPENDERENSGSKGLKT